MIKHYLTQKQQVVLCGLALFGAAFPAVAEGKRGLVCVASVDQEPSGLYCSIRTVRVLEALGLAQPKAHGHWGLTRAGAQLAKALIKVLS